MTPAERAAQLQEVNRKIREGAVDAGVKRMLGLLAKARREVLAELVETDWDRYAIPQRLAAIDRQLDHFRQLALDELKADMADLWKLGAEHAGDAAKALGIDVAFQELPSSLLQSLQQKSGQYISGLFDDAKVRLDQTIATALLTGQSREETIAAIGKILESGSTGKPEGLFGSISARARFIYRQEVAGIYARAAELRREQAAKYAPELKKVWAHDGHPKEAREGHALMHGQIREQDEYFDDPVTGDQLAYPRDPAADIGATANCTCSVYLWSEEYGDVREYIGGGEAGKARDRRVAAGRARGETPPTPITREDDAFNPFNYVVPGQPVVRDGGRR